MKFRAVIGAAMAMALTAGATGKEEQPIKIGVLTDMFSLYAAHGGPGSIEAARMAIDDFGGAVLGKPVELISADHRNNPDLGTSIARQWYGEGVDAMCQIRALRWRCSNSPEG
jgi:branched-chain amino acid transport system substrate-binding protein